MLIVFLYPLQKSGHQRKAFPLQVVIHQSRSLCYVPEPSHAIAECCNASLSVLVTPSVYPIRPLFVVVIYKVVGQTPAFIPKPLGHFGESFCLDQMVESKGRKHGSISVHFRFD
jgi:hypothetical protein